MKPPIWTFGCKVVKVDRGEWIPMVWSRGAQKSRRRLDGHSQLPKLVLSVTFVDGSEVIAKPTHHQPTTAAA